jgi:hypothetical protein
MDRRFGIWGLICGVLLLGASAAMLFIPAGAQAPSTSESTIAPNNSGIIAPGNSGIITQGHTGNNTLIAPYVRAN